MIQAKPIRYRLWVFIGIHVALAGCTTKTPSSSMSVRPATTAGARQTANADQQALRAAVDEWHNPATRHDAAALTRILATDFVQTQPPPAPSQTKARILELSASPRVVSKAVLENVRIVITGDTARVTGLETLVYMRSNVPGRVAFTEIWVRSESGWQLKSSALEGGWGK